MKARTLILGVLGFWFCGLMIAGLVLFFFGGVPRVPGRIGNHIAAYWLFYGILIFMAGWLAYIWNVFHNPRMPRDKRALWAVVLFFAGPYAMPFYFWFYIREGASQPASPPPALPGQPS